MPLERYWYPIMPPPNEEGPFEVKMVIEMANCLIGHSSSAVTLRAYISLCGRDCVKPLRSSYTGLYPKNVCPPSRGD